MASIHRFHRMLVGIAHPTCCFTRTRAVEWIASRCSRRAAWATMRVTMSVAAAIVSVLLGSRTTEGRQVPRFYECRIVPLSGREYCIARYAPPIANHADRVAITLYRRHPCLPMPSPAAVGWVMELLEKGLPIDHDVSASPLDTMTRAVTLDYPPRRINLSASGLGAALIGTNEMLASTFDTYPFITGIPACGRQAWTVDLRTLFPPSEIERRTEIDGYFKFGVQSWIDEKRHRLILTDFHETNVGPPRTVFVVDMLDGAARRGSTADIAESLDNRATDALYHALRAADAVTGADIESRFLAIMKNPELSIGVRTLAADRLRKRGNKVAIAFLDDIDRRRSQAIRRDPRIDAWSRSMPLLAAEIGFTPTVDQWLAFHVSSRRE